jgi:excisionase family DNA binding protein
MQLDKDLYTIKEVAAMFGVTLPTVYDWMNRRGLVWIRVGARRRITRDAIEAFIRSGREADAQTPGTAAILVR